MTELASILRQAIALHQQGKLQAASELYQDVLERDPRQPDALHLLGVIARQSGRSALAIELITESIGIDSSQPQPHCNLGAALHDAGRTEEALASYERAIALHPGYDIAHCNRGNALRKLGRLDQALASYERALQLRPAYPEAACNRAIVLHDLGRSAEALASAEQALAARGNYPDALRARGNALQALGRFEEAADSYERAIGLRPGDEALYCSRGTALQRMGRFDAALADYDRAIALRPAYPAAHHYRANSLLALARRDEAIAAYRTARELGADAEHIGFALAALGAEAAPAGAPENYVRALFDQYAGHFDEHLVEVLGYRTPALIDAALGRLGRAGPFDTLDLGCGTGLCGPVLKPRSRSLAGVDLSENMLDKARARGVYDRLACMDINAYMEDKQEQFDLLVAADVFVYLGELGSTFALARLALRADGVFCFSVEDSLGPDFMLQASNRYAHSLPYLQRLAAGTGFTVAEAVPACLRMDKDAPVTGHVLVLVKTADCDLPAP